MADTGEMGDIRGDDTSENYGEGKKLLEPLVNYRRDGIRKCERGMSAPCARG